MIRKIARFFAFSRWYISAPLLLFLFAGVNYAEIELGVEGTVGYYLLPKQVGGHVVDLYNYQFINSGYVDAGSNALYSSQYRYNHPFPKDNAANAGFRLSAQYLFPERFGIGFEYANGYSMQDYSADQSVTDSLTNGLSVIPSAYQMQTVSSHTTIQMQHSLFGLLLSFKKQLTKKTDIGACIGLGYAQYATIFKIEQKSLINRYYQSNGHEVYSESLTPSAFAVTGINYASFYVRPEIFARYELSTHVGVRAGLSIPLSYIDHGTQWTDGNESNNYSSTQFYPDKRFFAGALSMSAGLSITFGHNKK